jgi:hypothetical protein
MFNIDVSFRFPFIVILILFNPEDNMINFHIASYLRLAKPAAVTLSGPVLEGSLKLGNVVCGWKWKYTWNNDLDFNVSYWPTDSLTKQENGKLFLLFIRVIK